MVVVLSFFFHQMTARIRMFRAVDIMHAALKGNFEKLRTCSEWKTAHLNPSRLKFCGGKSTLLLAAHGGSIECVKFCLEQPLGGRVNDIDDSGSTPLHAAVQSGHLDVVKYLLDLGAVLDTETVGLYFANELTPLNYAIRFKHFDVAKVLLDRGASIAKLKFDRRFPEIPSWVDEFIASRSACRNIAILLIGMRKLNCSKILKSMDKYLIRFLSMHIWSTRLDDDRIGSVDNGRKKFKK